MNGVTIAPLGALIFQFAIGLAVFQANRRRLANQCFLLLSLSIAAWLGSLFLAFIARTPQVAEFAIRQASAAGVVYLTVLNLLRLSVGIRREGWLQIARHSWIWILLTTGAVALCQTRWFLASAHMPALSTEAPSPVYGTGVYLYSAYFIAIFLGLIVSYRRDIKNTTGAEHAELSFLLIGGIAAMVFALLLSFILDYFLGPTRAIWFAPFRIVVFSLVIAYGIATRKIMEVGFFLRRSMGVAVLAAYLLALYALIWWLVDAVFFAPLGADAGTLAHVVAAIAVAFAMAPARGLSQTLANRLFIGTRGLDFRATMNEAAGILKSVTTLDELLQRFAKTIGGAVGTDRVVILLDEKEAYRQKYPLAENAPAKTPQLTLGGDQAIIAYLRAHQEVIVLDELHRLRETPEVHSVAEEMKSLSLAIAMGIFSREHLTGVMLLGPRLSGRIYGVVEQNALLVLCGQLAVAIENAELFTEVQNAKIYNETLLANLTTGVIAAGADERITVFNNEAGFLADVEPRLMLDRQLDELPEGVADLLRETLRTGERQESGEITLRSGERSVIVRASSSLFHGENGSRLGALVVLTDITALRRLEQQIRRSDRLASLGTLSAGMAHEIKNPLVSIKTFAQLLPERYQDSDFRDMFSTLIGHEIDRIDSLVNQLLRFARPAKPLLKPMHVHDVLEKALQLVGHKLYQGEIKLARSWGAEVDTIRADADQLEQVFLNFFLNAMDAMKNGGELTVATEIVRAEHWVTALSGQIGDDAVDELLRITVRDNGEGIKREDIPHVFDPFFTTKDYGTGLGLSVVHGIIEEHGGQIEVESELSHGTAFHILLPLVRFGQEAVAA